MHAIYIYKHVMECYLAVLRNGVLIHATTWINLEDMPDRRASHMLHDSIHEKCPEEANSERQKVAEWLPGAAGRVRGVTTNGCRASGETIEMF